MNRISQRIEEAMMSVKCPGCGTVVQPTEAGPAPDTTAAGPEGGGRWSFVWRAPSGRVCPECNFPLERYARRVKWIRLFSAGVVLVTIAVLMYVVSRLAEMPGWWVSAVRVVGGLGGLAFVVGLTGLVVGGRRPTGQELPSGS